MRSPEIIVIGGGAIGASCAWQLAQDGTAVTLIADSGAPAASMVAAGMLAPVTEAEFGEEQLFRLNVASSDLFPAFIEQLRDAVGDDGGYRQCGTVLVARDQDDNRVLDEVHDFQLRLGVEARRLSGRAVRDLEPALSPRVRGGIVVDGDHQVDPPALTEALLSACEAAGVQRVAGRVTMIDGATVTLEDGDTLSCATVVLAAGARCGEIAGIPGLPVRPVKGQLVHLRSHGGVPLPSRNVRGLDVYVVTRSDGRVVVGATVEEQGFDPTLTARAAHDLLRDAYEVLPGLLELEFVGVTAGFRPATPDNCPAIGWLTDRVIVATGHYRNGVLLAPITAKAVVSLVNGDNPDALAAFDPHRFIATRSPQ